MKYCPLINASFFISQHESKYFDDGSLLIRHQHNQHEVVLKLLGWKQGCHLFLREENNNHVKVGEEVLLPSLNIITKPHDKPGLPVYDFILAIPESIRKVLGEFFYRQLNLLQVCALSTMACDLLISNPLLLWMWVATQLKTKQSITKIVIEQSLKHKQTRILSYIIGQQMKTSDMKLLKKIRVYQGSEDELNSLIQLFKSPLEIRYQLKHYQLIPIKLIDLLLKNSDWVTYKIFIQISLSVSNLMISINIDKAERLINHVMGMNDHNIKPRLKQCQTIDELEKLHDRQLRMYLIKKNAPPDREFPPPKIIDEQGFIIAIHTQEQLNKESLIMQHCVSSLGEQVNHSSNVYFYKVIYPQRATIEISYNYAKANFVLVESRLKNNKTPDSKTIEYIQNWLNTENRNYRHSS
jgi:hypothetical protein